jgi:GNAT superfamily N-acetyltransferase
VADRPLNIEVELLADRPDLLVPLARIRWNEWGSEPGREELQFWVDITSSETGQVGLPVTFVASAASDDVLGGVGLIPVEYPELGDRGPWVAGTIVRPDLRGRGVGSALMSHLLRYASSAGFHQVWVATGGRAVDFYRGCGFSFVEQAHLADGEETSVLAVHW